MIEKARRSGAYLPYSATTAYINTIPTGKEARSPGDNAIEHRIRSYVRWNAMAMVLRANKNTNVGGHIASFASAATLYDVGYNHFWHAPCETHGGDLVYVQGHSSPGAYAYAFLSGELSQEQLDNFRQEAGGNGLSSYPHPWLMPNFWQFPTVSMGLGPLMAIYQARFMKYLGSRSRPRAAPPARDEWPDSARRCPRRTGIKTTAKPRHSLRLRAGELFGRRLKYSILLILSGLP